MCIHLFIASDHELPTIPENPTNPGPICVGTVREDHEIRRHFKKPHVYQVGVCEWCACGFTYGQYLGSLEDEEGNIEDVRHLRKYVEKALDHGPVEAYSVWVGEEHLPPETRRTVTPSHFGGDSFTLNEREFLLVVKERRTFPRNSDISTSASSTMSSWD